MTAFKEESIPGIALSSGWGVGPLFFLRLIKTKIAEATISPHQVDREISRYRQALCSSKNELDAMKSDHASSSEVTTIIDTHLSMLQDPLMTEAMEEQIRSTLQNPEVVFQSVITAYQNRFSKQTNPFFQQRRNDIADLAHRVLGHLCAETREEFSQIPPGVIVLASELTPLQIVNLSKLSVAGIVTTRGGRESHAALIAKAKRLPYLAGIDIEHCRNVEPSSCAILDANRGHLLLNPQKHTMIRYQTQEAGSPLAPSVKTKEGEEIFFSFNLSSPCEWTEKNLSVGLFRTEFPLLENPDLAHSEERQKDLYAAVFKKAKGKKCTFRLFDIGGDKIPSGWNEAKPLSSNQLRGIQFLLHTPSLLITQLRSLLLASSGENLRILIPFVSSAQEIRLVKNYLSSLALASCHIELGAMIELPEAVDAIDSILDEVDFVTLGTNDLIEFTLGIDRTQAHSLPFPPVLHPRIVSLVHRTIVKTIERKKEISICGDRGSDPLYAALLIGMGLRHFSCSIDALLPLQKIIPQISIQEMEELLPSILSCMQGEEILALLQKKIPSP